MAIYCPSPQTPAERKRSVRWICRKTSQMQTLMCGAPMGLWVAAVAAVARMNAITAGASNICLSFASKSTKEKIKTGCQGPHTPFPTLFFCGCAHKLKQTISHAHTHTHHPSPTPPLHTHHTLNHIIHFQLNNELAFSCVFSALCHEQRSHHRIISYNSSE